MQKSLFLVNEPRVLAIVRFRLADGLYTIGRSSKCDFCLPDITVSRRHAEIHCDGLKIAIRDLDSRNGTFVDERQVQEGVAHPGQKLRFGSIGFLLTDNDAIFPEESDMDTSDPRETRKALSRLSGILRLTPAQRRVTDLILEGLPEKAIADRLEISRHTVHNHIRQIYGVFGVHARPELMRKLLAGGTGEADREPPREDLRA